MFGGGIEYRTFTSRLIPYIDLRMIGLFGSDPREGAYITVTGGLKYQPVTQLDFTLSLSNKTCQVFLYRTCQVS